MTGRTQQSLKRILVSLPEPLLQMLSTQGPASIAGPDGNGFEGGEDDGGNVGTND
jgi:hypothetical protein